MNKGWNVIQFFKHKEHREWAWFDTKEEAQEEAETLNLRFKDTDTWFGWERDK